MKTKQEKIAAYAEKKKAAKILKFLDDKEEAVQEAAYRALGQVGGEAAEEALQNSIRHPSARIRRAVADAFQHCGNDHVAEALHHQMLQETDPELREAFKKALENCRGKRSGE